MTTERAVKVYFAYGEKCWRIGPLGRWKVGDDVLVPERPPRFGQRLSGGPARVVCVDPDGMATAVRSDVTDEQFRTDVLPAMARASRGQPGRSRSTVTALAIKEMREGKG